MKAAMFIRDSKYVDLNPFRGMMSQYLDLNPTRGVMSL